MVKKRSGCRMGRMQTVLMVLCISTAAHGRDSYYLVTLEEAESSHPALRDCGLNIYGTMTYYVLLNHYRRTLVNSEARFVLFPPYFTCEHNWPVYGGGSFDNNMARTGLAPLEKSACRKFALDLAATWEYLPEQLFVIHDGSGDWLSGHDFPHMWNLSRAIIAKGNTLVTHYRQGQDISMPPPATLNVLMYRNVFSSTKQHLVAFKGDLNTHKLRSELAKLHNPAAGVVIVGRDDSKVDYDALMANSNFSLVVHGHVPFSYRFSEAVCHNTIPVIIADAWVPPFSEIVPLRTYGLRVAESEVANLISVLQNISDTDREQKRVNAMRFCYSSIITPYHQIETMLKILFRRKLGTSVASLNEVKMF